MLQVVHHLFQPPVDQVIAALRQAADKELESSPLRRHPLYPVAGGHGEFIEVGEKAEVRVRGVEGVGHGLFGTEESPDDGGTSPLEVNRFEFRSRITDAAFSFSGSICISKLR